jgi:hypothetical protein
MFLSTSTPNVCARAIRGQPNRGLRDLRSTIARMSAWPFRSGPLRARPRREQPAVLAVHQRLMKRQERRRADGDSDFLDAPRIEEERPESAQHPVAQREIRRALTTTRTTMSCCLSKRFSASSDRTPPGPRSFTAITARCQHREYEVPHTRISVGQTVGAVQRCSIMDSARELVIRDAQHSRRRLLAAATAGVIHCRPLQSQWHLLLRQRRQLAGDVRTRRSGAACDPGLCSCGLHAWEGKCRVLAGSTRSTHTPGL